MKGRSSAIEKYLTKKGFKSTGSKGKELSEYLAGRLDQFMKVAIEQMYDIACLKNKKNPKFGNELTYFSD